ncbi:Uracil phosphoribosyltransferase [Diplonema papillatum]|nr:Uracil phosphoribosyltransferase [Diplonema papillatum]
MFARMMFRGALGVGVGAGAVWVKNSGACCEAKAQQEDFAKHPKIHVMTCTQQMRAIQTIIRDRDTSRQDFVFFADRLMRALIEEALSFAPFKRVEVTTPTAEKYDGLAFSAKICGVSIMRAGESMENALRHTCRDVRIGKILIQRDEVTGEPDTRFNYAKLPADIQDRYVFLLDPMLATGGSAIRAVSILKDHGVKEEKIIFVNVVCCPEGLESFQKACPQVQIVTSAIDNELDTKKYILPGLGDFGDRYFGTAGW